MGTRCGIAIKQKDNTYKSISCQSDGYLEHTGLILYKDYSEPLKVELLLNLGDISVLKEHIFPDTTKEHTFDNRQDDVTVAYHRDRGERLRFNVFNNKEELIKDSSMSDQKYLYIFENGKWEFADVESKIPDNIIIEDLEHNLLDRNLIDNPSFTNNYYEDELAVELMNYAKDFDTYEYNDVYDSDDDAFNDMKKNLATPSTIDTMIEWLCNDIHYFASENDLGNYDISDLSKRAFNLLTKLNQYSKVLEKNEDKEMDM
ncbi:MAG: hypothetical protein ACI310_00555 [Bacilli bacterium]